MNMVTVHPFIPLSRGRDLRKGGFPVRLSEAQPRSNVPFVEDPENREGDYRGETSPNSHQPKTSQSEICNS